MDKLTCWACHHNKRIQEGPTAFEGHHCELNRQGWPHIGSKCKAYLVTEAGTDEQVWREERGES